MIAEISMLDFQLEKLNGEDSIEPNFEEMTSEEIILWYLKRYTQYRNALLGNIPQENMVKVKAVQPLKPYASFPSDQASTIMDFNADDVIILLGVIDDDWLIGYLEEDKRQIIKIFPKKFVRLEFYYLPFPQRSYTITNWENFGSSKDYIRKDDPPFFHPNLIAFKSKDNVR